MIAQLSYLLAALLTLAAYAALAKGVVNASSRWYQGLNFVAGLLGAASALAFHVWGAVLLNTAWSAIAAYSLWSTYRTAR